MRSLKVTTRPTPAKGAFRLSDSGLVSIDSDQSGPVAVYVPTESILLTIIGLPIASRQHRLTALPFAIEGQIAGPLDTVHIALGIEVVPGSFLVGAVAHEKIIEWVSQLTTAGLDRAAIVPDVLRLPIPLPACWNIESRPDRVLVRDANGAGFAASTDNFLTLWKAAGSPSCAIYGPLLGIDLPVSCQRRMPALNSCSKVCALDLRQGRYVISSQATWLEIWRLIAIITIGITAHIAIAQTVASVRSQTTAESRLGSSAITKQVLHNILFDIWFNRSMTLTLNMYESLILPSRFVAEVRFIHYLLTKDE